MADEEKIRERVFIEYPAGTELSKSRKSKDGRSPLVRSTDKTKRGVQTQVEIFGIDEDEEARPAPRPIERERQQAGRRWEPTPEQRDVIMDVVGYGVESVLDRIELIIRRWWADRPVRLAEKARLREVAVARAAAAIESETPAEVESAESSDEAEGAADVPVVSMTAEAWRNTLGALLLTRAMSTELWQVLAHAQIEDADDDLLEQQREMAQLTPQEFDDRVAAMLEEDPGLVDAPLSELLVRLVPASPSAERPVLVSDSGLLNHDR